MIEATLVILGVAICLISIVALKLFSLFNGAGKENRSLIETSGTQTKTIQNLEKNLSLAKDARDRAIQELGGLHREIELLKAKSESAQKKIGAEVDLFNHLFIFGLPENFEWRDEATVIGGINGVIDYTRGIHRQPVNVEKLFVKVPVDGVDTYRLNEGYVGEKVVLYFPWINKHIQVTVGQPAESEV